MNLPQMQSTLFILAPVLELFLLYILSQSVFTRLAGFVNIFIKKTSLAYYIIAALFLPGTYVHELAHYIMAKVLFVETFEISLRPKIEKGLIRLGSVKIARTDFLRRALIGAAPFLFGICFLLGSIHLFLAYHWQTHPVAIVIQSLITFQIGNTMFMSKRDREGLWKVGLLGIVLATFIYLSGIDIHPFISNIFSYQELFRQISLYLFVPIVLDIIIVFLLFFVS